MPVLRAADKRRALDHYARIANGYHRRVEFGPLLRALRSRERRAVVDLLALERGVSLADIGCGNGFYAVAAKRLGLRVCAIDAVPQMLAALAGSVDEVRIRDVEDLSGIGEYDRVVCAGVLDFVLDQERAVANVCRIVAPGGRLVVLVPARSPGGYYYLFEKRLFGFRVNLFTPSWLSARIAAGGLRVVDVRRPLPWNLAVAAVRDHSH
jgi:2-polyprenyl-3-methyl-5-hydroxy-6-metoxy-1,4-benzoquinol methylase